MLLGKKAILIWVGIRSMTKVVFFDTDCLLSFLIVNQLSNLCVFFENGIILPRQVYEEIIRWKEYKLIIDSSIKTNVISILDIEVDSIEDKLYMELIKPHKYKTIGKGEAAAIACAKSRNVSIASNNLKDVKWFVESYSLDHFTTARILSEMIDLNIYTLEFAERLWERMKNHKYHRKLPNLSLEECYKNKLF